MPYTHIVIALPTLTSDQLHQQQEWKQFRLLGTVSTPEASTFVFASDQPLGLLHSSFLLASHPAILFLYGNCDGTPRAQGSNL